MGDAGRTEEFPAADSDRSIRAEVVACLEDGLQFLKSDAADGAQKLAKRILANIIIEHLALSGFSIRRHSVTAASLGYEMKVVNLGSSGR